METGNDDLFRFETELAVHGTQFFVSISTPNDNLVVEVEEILSGERWRGQFPAKYIEDITTKTGNFQRFAAFARMLAAGLSGSSDAVVIDLLTYDDLERMKQRQAAEAGAAPPARSAEAAARNKHKRYLILTSIVDLDRVHYPLPLAHQDSLDPDQLKRTIRRLRDELAAAARHTDNLEPAVVRSLKADNDALRAKIQMLDDAYVVNGRREEELAYQRTEVDALRTERQQLESENANLTSQLSAQTKETYRLRKDAEQRLLETTDQSTDVELLKDALLKMEDEMNKLQATVQKWEARYKSLLGEHETLINAEKSLRDQLQQSANENDLLNDELEQLRIKLATRPPAPPSKPPPRNPSPSRNAPASFSRGASSGRFDPPSLSNARPPAPPRDESRGRSRGRSPSPVPGRPTSKYVALNTQHA
eukprot:TRINITY_DN5161_c0_g1_i1.p1 TRINITY_DN5161_c0_g1~~TRINITY_DN5161_c0_g1_i1.p1  ORF type:complete len:421 (+),score=178.47 TRINITY_DN5161_c0_g1_i1:91-1353(+)